MRQSFTTKTNKPKQNQMGAQQPIGKTADGHPDFRKEQVKRAGRG